MFLQLKWKGAAEDTKLFKLHPQLPSFLNIFNKYSRNIFISFSSFCFLKHLLLIKRHKVFFLFVLPTRSCLTIWRLFLAAFASRSHNAKTCQQCREREKRGEEEKEGQAELLSAATGPLTGISNSAAECRLGTKLTLLVFCCGFLERVAAPREGRVRGVGFDSWVLAGVLL